MKNKFKSFSISLMIVFLLVTISCQVEETIVETENIKNQNDLLIKKISFNEIKNSAVVDKINNTKKLSKKTITTSSKIIKDTLNNFYINSDEGMYIEKTDGTKSYTFSVFRENATDLENLVIIVYPNNQIKTFLVDYNKTFNDLNSMSLEQMQNNQVEYYEIDFNTSTLIPITQNNQNGRYICVTAYVWDIVPCNEGNLVGEGIHCWGWVVIGHTCWEGGSGGGEGFGFSDTSDFGTNGNGAPTGGGGSAGSGSSGSSSNEIITTPTTSLESEQEAQALIKRQKNFALNLNWTQSVWLNNNLEAENSIYTYLESQVTDPLDTEYSIESVQFAEELIDLAILEPNQEDVNNILNLITLFERNEENIFDESTNETYLPLINQYVELNTADPILTQQLITYFTVQCAVLRYNHPDWSNAKIYWEASKELIHISLDGFGLLPLVGEPADLLNGVLYTIEGDGVNATLSFAGAVPLAGWAATGTKMAIKINNVSSTAYTVATKVKLTWKIIGGVVTFGDRAQLRKVLGMGSSAVDPRQAHHLIPWSSQSKMAVQRAAQSGSAFHMNEALNGIPVAAWRNQPNHQTYNNVINAKLDDFRDLNQNATPQECYDFLIDLIQDIRTWVINNPNKHLNEIVLP